MAKDNNARDKVRERVARSRITVKRFREPENKTALKNAASMVKNDVVGFFGEVRNIVKQTEGLESYSTCKQNPTCSDAIEEYKVHVPPMYDEVLTDEPIKKTSTGKAILGVVTDAIHSIGDILHDAGSMEAYANRHQAFPGDPTKFDADRPQSVLFKEVDDKIRKKVTVVETPEKVEVVKDPNAKPMTTPVHTVVNAARAVGEILDDAGNMEAYANRHQAFPGDPTKFDANRPQSVLFKDVDDKIRKNVEVTETIVTEEVKDEEK